MAGRAAAEIGTLLAATTFVPLVKSIAPERYDRLKKHLSRAVVLPHVDWLEKHIFNSPAFAQVGAKLKETESAEEKSLLMADALVDFAAMMGAGIAGQAVVQSASDHMFGLPNLVRPTTKGYIAKKLEHSGNMVVPVIFDKVLNLGVVSVMQAGLPQTTTAVTDITSSFLQKTLGLPPQATQYFLQWQLPNLVGLAGSSILLSRKYSKLLSAVPHGAHQAP